VFLDIIPGEKNQTMMMNGWVNCMTDKGNKADHAHCKNRVGIVNQKNNFPPKTIKIIF